MTVTVATRSLEEQFDLFCAANSFQSILNHFNQLCALAVTAPTKHPWAIHTQLTTRLKCYWKAAALFERLEKRIRRPEYMHQTACSGLNVMVVGCGPCGLRCAIELALLGARVVIVEKRDTFSRNNVLHLWPYLIEDLRALGAKTFFGKFCAGSIDHVSIRTLQCILLKVALLFGVQVFVGVTFRGLIEPVKGSGVAKFPPIDRVFLEHESIVSLPNGKHKLRSTQSSSSPTISPDPTDADSVSASGTVSPKSNGFTKPPDSAGKHHGWRVQLEPESDVLSQYDVDVLIGADGKRSCLGFPSKELRCRLALAITVNFVNYHTPAETQVEEISGVSSIFNQQFFARLAADTGIDLENIVYYKDETHYFVMTAKKHSLLAKGVLRQDREDSNSLLNPENIDKQALQAYARETAQYVTNGQLSQLDFAVNARGEPDVEVFDFTRMFAAEYSCRISERNECLLMQCLIGDGLFEPFWPTGSGCALGFLSALDAAWAVSRLASGLHPLQVIVQRESVYQRLSQTTAQNMPPNFADYTLDPRTRYVRCDLNLFSPAQVRHLYCTDAVKGYKNMHKWYQDNKSSFKTSSNLLRDQVITARSSSNRSSEQYNALLTECNLPLLRWFQFRLAFYESLDLIDPVIDLTPAHWDSGTNLLCLIHLYRPDLIPELEQFLLGDDTQSDPRSVLHRYATAPHPKPSLIRACGLLIEHFNVEFVSDVEPGTSTYPRSVTDWKFYLMLIQQTLSQLRMAGPPSLTATAGRWTPLTRTQSMVSATNLINKSPTKAPFNDTANLRKKPVLEKRINSLQTNGRARGVFREDPNWSVEKGLLFKRRAELIATLQDPASTKRRTPIPPHLRPSSDKHMNVSERFVLSNLALNSVPDREPVNGHVSPSHIKPQMIKPIAVPESVARLFAPRKGSAHCYVCEKRLYLIERLMAFGLFFHRHCFRCSECGCQLQADKATCLRSAARDTRDRFFCPAHSHLANTVIAPDPGKLDNRPRANPSSTGVSLEARLRAGQFPFGPPDRAASTQQLQDPRLSPLSSTSGTQSVADLIPHSRPPPAVSSGQFRSRPVHSALLAGLRDENDAEEVMGVVNVPALVRRFRDSAQILTDSSSTPSPERRPPSRLIRPVGPTGDGSRQNGIRDDAAPGPDCYLAGHLGLPEVERRANWELNQSSAWPDTSIPDILEHMRMNRVNLFALDDYFASSESEQVSNATDSAEPAMTSSTLTEEAPKQTVVAESTTRSRRVPPKRRKEPRLRVRIPSANATAATPSALTTNTATRLDPSPSERNLSSLRSDANKAESLHEDWPTVPVGSLTSVHTASATSSLLSSPAHQSLSIQSRLAAKQKFCLEPPKPFTIDPKQFVSSRNRDRCVTAELSDCSEQLETIADPDVEQASVDSVEPLSNSAVRLHLVQILDDTQPVSVNQAGNAKLIPTSDTDHKLLTDVSMVTTVDCLSDWQETKLDHATTASSGPVAPFAALDEFQDIDSMSTVTERSSTEHRTDSDHRSIGVRGQSINTPILPPPRVSASQADGDYDNVTSLPHDSKLPPALPHYRIAIQPKRSYLSPSSVMPPESHRRVHSEDRLLKLPRPDASRMRVRSMQSELDESDTSETTSSADLDSVMSIRPLPGAFARITPNPTGGVQVRFGPPGLEFSPNREASFRSRCADRNRQAVELTRELESLENTMWKLEQAGVQTERELYSINPRSAATSFHVTPAPNNLLPGAHPFPRNSRNRARARTLNYNVSHATFLPTGPSPKHNPAQLHSASERRYMLLKRLATLLATKSMLLEYASTLTERRDQLRLADEPDEEEAETGSNCNPCSGSLTRWLSDPNLSQVQLDRLTELQTRQSAS